VLVTGGCGFIGSHFVKRLSAQGADVVVLDKLTYSGVQANLDGIAHTFVYGDIADPEAVERAGERCTVVVNFAAETHVDRSILAAGGFIRTDVTGTHVLLEWARNAGARFLQVSTDEVYGDLERRRPARESDALRPSSPYAAAKASADLLSLSYSRTYGLDAVISRGANTYGTFQHPEKLIPLFVTNALDARPLPIYGDGRQRRDWLHVDDHCAALDVLLERGVRGEIYNVGAGDERENLELTRMIVELTGADASLVRHVADRPGHDRRYALDTSRMRALGWEPKHPFEDGLQETVAWYSDNRSWWEPLKSGEFRDYYSQQYDERLA
jgi:dTDP-glucose 4,6-dehydratase